MRYWPAGVEAACKAASACQGQVTMVCSIADCASAAQIGADCVFGSRSNILCSDSQNMHKASFLPGTLP